MATEEQEEEEAIVVFHQILFDIRLFLLLFMRLYYGRKRRCLNYSDRPPSCYSLIGRQPKQIEYMATLVGENDIKCRDNLRMNRDTFGRLCYLLENLGGLTATRNVQVGEQVAIFLKILGHHTKNVVASTDFKRSGYTISKHFNRVLLALLRLHTVLLITPKPVDDDLNNERWSYFKGSLGALDGSHIEVRAPRVDKTRYRNRKGEVSVNVLAVCDVNMNFIYLLTGWEGSAADSRILRDAISRPNGFKVPTGNYYLVDGGYTNANGFLAPYRKTRYHLKAYGPGRAAPRNFREYFNMKHAKARNIIERAFGVLKSRWGILRSPAYYPIKVQNRIIMACCLLHNFIRTANDVDHEEANVPEFIVNDDNDEDTDDEENDEVLIENVEPSQQWTSWRDNIAMSMYNEYLANR